VLATDILNDGADVRPPATHSDSVAVLQYTSGSTSLLRGMMLSHANLLANCADIMRGFDMNDRSSGASCCLRTTTWV
jgi:long-subunit acyl-CoA synthetase (AMP-forming)